MVKREKQDGHLFLISGSRIIWRTTRQISNKRDDNLVAIVESGRVKGTSNCVAKHQG
jgi:hypothetical protein